MANANSKLAAAIVELHSRSLLLFVMGAAINREPELYGRKITMKSLAHVVRTITLANERRLPDRPTTLEPGRHDRKPRGSACRHRPA